MEKKVRVRMHVCDATAVKFIEEHNHAGNGQHK